MREGALGAAASLTVQACVVALLMALAVWLLVAQAPSDSEQRVFTLGSLLLLGGAAEYLSLSALLAGFVAGAFWNSVGGPACEHVRRDVHHLQHPLVVLLLVIAGARVDVTPVVLGLAVVYLVFRTLGKVVGGRLARRVAPSDLPSPVGLGLMSPGIVGIAFALNALEAGSDGTALVLAVAVAGTLGSEVLALLVRSLERPA